MISDVLCDALNNIRRYQRDFGDIYADRKDDIDRLRVAMAKLLMELDCALHDTDGSPIIHDNATYQALLRGDIGPWDAFNDAE